MENGQNNEEISLVDLLAVMVRYRKLILIGSLVTILLGAVWVFALPKIKEKKNPVQPPEKLVYVVYTINSHHNGKNQNVDFSKILPESFKSLPDIANEYKAHPFWGYGFQNDREFNNFIDGFVKGNFFVFDIEYNR